jgi:hypothetical protein
MAGRLSASGMGNSLHDDADSLDWFGTSCFKKTRKRYQKTVDI